MGQSGVVGNAASVRATQRLARAYEFLGWPASCVPSGRSVVLSVRGCGRPTAGSSHRRREEPTGEPAVAAHAASRLST
jgi:hypothetical protein